MESVQVAVKIELGHKASCKKTPSPEGFTHDWVVFVRGPDDCDISHFVEKVVFYLHESFAKPKRGKARKYLLAYLVNIISCSTYSSLAKLISRPLVKHYCVVNLEAIFVSSIILASVSE